MLCDVMQLIGNEKAMEMLTRTTRRRLDELNRIFEEDKGRLKTVEVEKELALPIRIGLAKMGFRVVKKNRVEDVLAS